MLIGSPTAVRYLGLSPNQPAYVSMRYTFGYRVIISVENFSYHYFFTVELMIVGVALTLTTVLVSAAASIIARTIYVNAVVTGFIIVIILVVICGLIKVIMNATWI